MIYIDSRGCGVGKTTQTIIPRIKQNLAQGIKSLIVVPSINLQLEYLKLLPTATIINSEDRKNMPSVGVQFNAAMLADDDIIICTHQAFLYNINIAKTYRTNRELIIDEAFDPYAFESIELANKEGKRHFFFEDVFYWASDFPKQIEKEFGTQLKKNQNRGDFYQIGFKSYSTPSLLVGSEQWEKLTGSNSIIWGTYNSGQALINNAATTAQVVIETDANILDGWSSIWIAAAAFEHTFMHQWLKSNKLEYTEVYPFVEHQVNLKIHVPIDQFYWTKALRNSDDSFLNLFVDYVNTNATGPVVYVNNNDKKSKLISITNGHRINHNAHGVNAYKHLTNYAHMSAINPNAMNYLFYKNHLHMEDKQIIMAFHTYNTYQLLMRTSLRNKSSDSCVNGFFLDTRIAVGLINFFRTYDVIEQIPVVDPKKSTRDSKKKSTYKPRTSIKKQPLTSAEKQKNYRERKKALKNQHGS